MKRTTISLAASALVLAAVRWANADATVTAKNNLDAPRPSETIELQWKDVQSALPSAKPDAVQVIDTATGKPVVSQAIDLEGTGAPSLLVFQADFAPSESKTFTLQSAAAPTDKAEPKVYGRYVPERLDDFAWENDRIAYRVYGPALEKVEPGSSGVDVWVKRTKNPVINKWYKMDKYHVDHGEGLDCYKVGHGRGCGGTAIFKDGKTYDSGVKGWETQKVLANGPVRLVFELTYAPFDAAGEQVTETKRVTLDAGQNLNKFESTFKTDKDDPNLTAAIGLTKHTDRQGEASLHKDQGWMSYWDAGDGKNNGNVGCGVVIDPSRVRDMTEANDHLWLLAQAEPGKPLTFYAGAGWDKSGDFSNVSDWNAYLEQFAKRVQSPLTVTVAPQ